MKNENNAATVAGMVATEPKRYDCCGELFYAFDLSVRRMSGAEDLIPVNMPVVLCDEVNVGDELCLVGQVRTYTKMGDGKSRLFVVFFALETADYTDYINEIELTGFSASLPYTAQRRSDATSATRRSQSTGTGKSLTISRSSFGAGRRA